MQNLEWNRSILEANSIKKILLTTQSHIKWSITAWTPESNLVQAVAAKIQYITQ